MEHVLRKSDHFDLDKSRAAVPGHDEDFHLPEALRLPVCNPISAYVIFFIILVSCVIN